MDRSVDSSTPQSNPTPPNKRYWAVESEFQETVLWRHDLAPPTDHCMQQVQEWCTLARAVRCFVGEKGWMVDCVEWCRTIGGFRCVCACLLIALVDLPPHTLFRSTDPRGQRRRRRAVGAAADGGVIALIDWWHDRTMKACTVRQSRQAGVGTVDGEGIGRGSIGTQDGSISR